MDVEQVGSMVQGEQGVSCPGLHGVCCAGVSCSRPAAAEAEAAAAGPPDWWSWAERHHLGRSQGCMGPAVRVWVVSTQQR
jgi:hypothetical protein